MTLRSNDFDRDELDIATALLTLLRLRGKGTRYKIALLTYAERLVEAREGGMRRPRRVFHLTAGEGVRVIGELDAAPNPTSALPPADPE